MKNSHYLPFFLLALLSSCATGPIAPSWVTGIRSGAESLKIYVGEKVYYRRIGGSSYQSKDESCDQTIKAAAEDIRKDFPLYEKFPYTVEVLFYDETNKDCAVTLSIYQKNTKQYLKLKDAYDNFSKKESELIAKVKDAEAERASLESRFNSLSDFLKKNAYLLEQVNNLQRSANSLMSIRDLRTENARRNAFTGISKHEFQNAIKDTVDIDFDSNGLCWTHFKTMRTSLHGKTLICWAGNRISGFCTTTDKTCFTR